MDPGTWGKSQGSQFFLTPHPNNWWLSPSPGLFSFISAISVPTALGGTHPGSLLGNSVGKGRPPGPLQRSLKWQGWDSSPGL